MFLFAFFFFLQGPHAFLYPLRCTNAAIFISSGTYYISLFRGIETSFVFGTIYFFFFVVASLESSSIDAYDIFSQLMSRWKTIDTEENDFQVQTDLTEGVPNKDERLFSFNLPET